MFPEIHENRYQTLDKNSHKQRTRRSPRSFLSIALKRMGLNTDREQLSVPLFELDYWDPASNAMLRMNGRARLSPYYFVAEGKAELAGILATICSAEKKIIHGMKDAIMVPCAVHPR